MHIDIIFDAICPWCYIGKRRLEQAIGLRAGIEVTMAWRPFLLNPEMPPEGIDRRTYLNRKFGNQTRVHRIFGSLANAGQSVEIDFDFDRIGRTPNTVNCHRLVRFAALSDKADAVVEALFLDYFVNGRDIGETAVLVKIAAGLGLDVEALRTYLASERDIPRIYEENSRVHRFGINGVPSFLFNGEMIISGAQEAPVLARMIDAARQLEAAG
jgi:predicted DsbA family dithiol-disulfide isomerase